MFTGLVDHVGTIKAMIPNRGGVRLKVETHFSDLLEGESISIDGVCLTVREPQGGTFDCDISPETLSKTTFNDRGLASRLNLERALRLGDRLGGHWVTGHVDKAVSCLKKEVVGEYLALEFGPFSGADRVFLINKGSIAINGVSLTINEVGRDYIQVMLIPHTQKITNLSTLQPKARVNIEFDWMAKVVLNRPQ